MSSNGEKRLGQKVVGSNPGARECFSPAKSLLFSIANMELMCHGGVFFIYYLHSCERFILSLINKECSSDKDKKIFIWDTDHTYPSLKF